jgi:hypothetical protein
MTVGEVDPVWGDVARRLHPRGGGLHSGSVAKFRVTTIGGISTLASQGPTSCGRAKVCNRATTRAGDAAVSKYEDAAEVQLSSCPVKWPRRSAIASVANSIARRRIRSFRRRAECRCGGGGTFFSSSSKPGPERKSEGPLALGRDKSPAGWIGAKFRCPHLRRRLQLLHHRHRRRRLHPHLRPCPREL